MEENDLKLVWVVFDLAALSRKRSKIELRSQLFNNNN